MDKRGPEHCQEDVALRVDRRASNSPVRGWV